MNNMVNCLKCYAQATSILKGPAGESFGYGTCTECAVEVAMDLVAESHFGAWSDWRDLCDDTRRVHARAHELTHKIMTEFWRAVAEQTARWAQELCRAPQPSVPSGEIDFL